MRGDLGPITETDFGYTGQRNISAAKLMDYNARFFSPTLGRFTQPDSIVPNPNNPQSLNRYAYTSNNPIRFVDPSGHCYQGPDSNECEEDPAEEPTEEELLAFYKKQLLKFGVTLVGTAWNAKEAFYVLMGVIMVAKKFAQEMGDGIKPSEAFKLIYGIKPSALFKFVMGPCGPRDAKGTTGCKGRGATTWGSREIEYDQSSPFYSTGPYRSQAQADIASIYSVIHELGHAFANRFKSNGPYQMTDKRKDLQTSDGYASEGAPFRANPGVSGNETFANMFVGWVVGEWAEDPAGKDVYMNCNMTNTWIPALKSSSSEVECK